MLKELQCVENIIPDLELPSFQNIGVQEILLNKRMLLAFDTGTGKTFTYSLFVRALLNRDPEKKHIYAIIHDSLDQAPKDIRGLTAVPVSAFTGAAGEYRRLKTKWASSSIIILTYEAFRDMNIAHFLFTHIKEIESITLDEAHHVSNWDSSDMALMVRALCQYSPYVLALTATPMTSKTQQYYRLLNLVDRDLSPRRDETAAGKYNARYMTVNRKDYSIKGNYKSTLELVTPHIHQIGEIKGIISKVMKGTGAVNQVQALLRVTDERLRQGKSVIIYVHYHDSRRWIEQHFTGRGIQFVSLHGKIVKMEERKALLSAFDSGEVKVLITSVAESLNIDADVVIFYEFTTKLKQVMGRAHRGLEGKELELVFILTQDTQEIQFFMHYIYKRSLTIQRLLGKDYSEFVAIGDKLKQLDLDT